MLQDVTACTECGGKIFNYSIYMEDHEAKDHETKKTDCTKFNKT